MHFNLKVLNLLHSLCDPSSDTPDAFRVDRYEVVSVEPSFDLPGGRQCNPECILSSTAAGNTILIESKSGTASSRDQIDRYRTVTQNVLLGAGLDLKRPALKAIDVVYICDAACAQGHVRYLDELKAPIAVLAYEPTGGGLKLVRGRLSHPQLDRSLRHGLAIQWPPTPHDFIPFDCQSEEMDIASAITPSIVAAATARRKSVESIDICKDAIRYWEVLSHPHKRALVKRIERVVENLVAVGFVGQFRVSPKSTKRKLIVEVTPAANRAALADANGYARRMLSMADDALTDLQQKLDREKQTGELPLFPDMILPTPPRPRRRWRK